MLAPPKIAAKARLVQLRHSRNGKVWKSIQFETMDSYQSVFMCVFVFCGKAACTKAVAAQPQKNRNHKVVVSMDLKQLLLYMHFCCM
jgi:hypothetical protein